MLIFFRPSSFRLNIVDIFLFVSIRINEINFINTHKNVSKNTKTNEIKPDIFVRFIHNSIRLIYFTVTN